MSLTPQQKALLDAKLAEGFVPHLAPLIQPEGEPKDGTKNLSRALAALAIASICEVEPKEAAASVVDDHDDYGVDAIYHHASTSTLYLVQAKLKPGAAFTQQEANAFAQGVRKIIRQDLDGFNKHVADRREDIEGAVGNCDRIELVVVHVGAGLSVHADTALNQLITEERPTEERLCAACVNFDAAKVAAYLHDSGAYARVDDTIHLKSSASRIEGRKAYIGFVAVNRLVELHRKHGKALFDKNIRQHLGDKTDANAAIRRTLADCPAEFEHLNNGVTILAETISPKDSTKHGKKLVLKGMSVINGAQTVASAAAFASEQPGADIGAAYALATVIQADLDRDFSKRVTRARNLQNPVLARNFAALDDEQERLRRGLALLGIQYVYKAEALDTSGNPNIIRIDEAAQALAVAHADPRFAVYLKKEPGQLLDAEGSTYKRLFTPTLTPQRLANAVAVFRHVQRRLATEERAAAGYERLTYKHGAYALGFVLAKQAEDALASARLIDAAKIDGAMSTAFDAARQRLWDAVRARTAYRGPLAIMRNIGEALPMLEAAMIAHYGLAADPALPHKRAQGANQEYRVALFDYLAAKAPQINGLT